MNDVDKSHFRVATVVLSIGNCFKMELRPQVLFVILILFIPRVIGYQAPTVMSSVEQAGKEAACPKETVTFTCRVYESNTLQWNFRGQTAKFTSVDNVGRTLDKKGFTAILLNIVGTNELKSSLTTILQSNYNGSHVNCTDEHQTTTTKVLMAAGISSPPTGFSEEKKAPMCQHNNVTIIWKPPEYSGRASITAYTLIVSDATYTIAGVELSLIIILPNDANYQAHLTASNCVGDSSPVHLDLNIIGCASPPPLERGSKNSSCTGENSVVKYQCDDGLMGRSEVICMKNGTWSPDPHELSCIESTGISCMHYSFSRSCCVLCCNYCTGVIAILGCLLMWCIMTKLVQTKQISHVTSSAERNSPKEASLSSIAPYYDNITVREDKFQINANAAYVKAGHQS